MSNRLMSPLFSVEEIDNVDQEVTEAKAIKAISNKAALNTPLPNHKSEEINLDVDFFKDNEFSNAISKLLNPEIKFEKTILEDDKKIKVIKSSLKEIEIEAEEDNKIPDFLLRKDNEYSSIGNKKLEEYVASKSRWSWKLPYAILFIATLTTWALFSKNYSLFLFLIAATPLFYKHKL